MNKKNVTLASVIILLFFSISVCMFNVYPSPVIWQPNEQFTHMNFAGSTWVVENRDTTIQNAQDYGFNLLRMEHYVNGIELGNRNLLESGIESLRIPTHFGYEGNDTLFQVFEYSTIYMITTENARQGLFAFPENVQAKVTQFTSNDFDKLYSDTTVRKLYENGEFECWLIGS